MKIYLDTSIICQDYYFKGTTARLFLESSKYLPATVIIPEVVFDEVINRFREDLNEAYVRANQDIDKLNKLSGKEIDIKLSKKNVVGDYEIYLRKIIDQYKIQIAEYPKIEHKQLVRRDLERKKPFKTNGSGYRDALIWETIRLSFLWGQEKIFLLSANSKDFGIEPNIDDDLLEGALNKHNIKIYNNIKSFMEEVGSKSLKRREIIDNELETYGIKSFDLHIWIKDQLLKELSYFDLETVLAGFPQGVGSARISEINEINKIEIEEIITINDEPNKTVAKTKVTLSVITSIDSDWDDYVNNIEVQEFWGSGSDKFSNTWTQVNQIVYVSIDLLFDLSKEQSFESVQITKIEGEYGSEEFS